MNRRLALGGLAAGCCAGVAFLRRRPDFDWAGKTVLITGGSRGLGLALARSLAERGVRIAICARDESELRLAESDLRKYSLDVLSLPADVSDMAQMERVVGAVLQSYDRLDVVINNAGVIQVGPYHTMTLDDFESAMKVIYWGTVHTTLASLPHMLARGKGTIVNITSIGGKVSVPHLLPYCCAKFAAVAFSEGLRSELSGTGIKTVTIAPGLMRTGSFLKASFKGDDEREVSWFALSASLPGLSMSAQRAATQIIAATERGAAGRTLGLPAQILALLHGISPGWTTEILGLVNRALPAGRGTQDRIMAPYVHRSKALDSLTLLGRKAGETYLQKANAL